MTLLHQIRKTSSTLAKQDLLKTADTFYQKIFKYTYDKSKTYGVKFNFIDWTKVKEPDQVMFDLLDKLASRELSGNAARDAVEKHALFYGELIKLVCNKDLDCGVSTTLINNVFGKHFIPKFKVQLAVEVPIKELELPLLGQIKYNGVRVVAIVEDQGVTFKTRNGHEFQFPALAETLTKLRSKCQGDFILDGELTIGDSSSSDHTTVSGIVTSALRGTPIKNKAIQYHVFDTMLLNDFNNQICKLPYKERFYLLSTVINNIEYAQDNDNTIHLAETYTFNTYEEVQAKFDELFAKGYEGLILKSEDHFYTFKRSKDWIKIKNTSTVDLLCTGIEEGSGKYTGMIGALICEGEAEGVQVTVNIGTGLSDADRSLNEDNYIGKTIEIDYNSIIQDKSDGSWSLFLPRFIIVRNDL